MKNKLFLFLLCLPMLFGCAAQQERRAKKQIQITCDKLIGATEEEVALTLGVPQKIENIGKLKVFQYYKSYGTQSVSNGYASGDNCWLWGSGHGIAWETYDKIDIFFKDGRVTTWKCAVKR